jgi:hypothetical protein
MQDRADLIHAGLEMVACGYLCLDDVRAALAFHDEAREAATSGQSYLLISQTLQSTIHSLIQSSFSAKASAKACGYLCLDDVRAALAFHDDAQEDAFAEAFAENDAVSRNLSLRHERQRPAANHIC